MFVVGVEESWDVEGCEDVEFFYIYCVGLYFFVSCGCWENDYYFIYKMRLGLEIVRILD